MSFRPSAPPSSPTLEPRPMPKSTFTLARSVARSLEHQHGAGDLARLHRAKRLVEVVEVPAAADHLVEEQPALAIELEVPGDVDAEAVRAHARRLHPALRADGQPRELDH